MEANELVACLETRLKVIAGISLTSENYSLVVKLLQERFGRKETIVESP